MLLLQSTEKKCYCYDAAGEHSATATAFRLDSVDVHSSSVITETRLAQDRLRHFSLLPPLPATCGKTKALLQSALAEKPFANADGSHVLPGP